MIPHEYFEKVKEYFNGSDIETWKWFKKPQASFGMFSPMDMLKLGKVEKVKALINKSLAENYLR